MTLTQDTRLRASRAADNPLLTRTARAGFLGYGLTHLLVAWLALQIALGHPAGAGDQGGALAELASRPFGRYLVLAICVGLGAMALWQALEAAVGHTADRGRERTAERLASAGKAVVYAYLAWIGLGVVTDGADSSAQGQQSTTAGLLAEPGGRWLVGLAGVAVVAVGAGLVWYGVVRRFEKHLRTGAMSPRVRTLSRRLGTAGYVAKGVAYGIAGALLVLAAVTFDPGRARGLDGALRALAEQPAGPPLLLAVAAGIAAFGVFCFVQARYRKV
ncbi:MAG TPA: DUF1206 domain-containing protein [Pilimelia sp.]|nr:DUF1206 domain-containing protein [Pilimelia sp.]